MEQLEEYRALGFDHVLVRHIVGDRKQMIRSVTRIGESVMPRHRALAPLCDP